MLLSERLRITPFLKILPCFAAGIFCVRICHGARLGNRVGDYCLLSACMGVAQERMGWMLFGCRTVHVRYFGDSNCCNKGGDAARSSFGDGFGGERYAGHTGKMAADNGGCRIVPSDRCGCGYMDPDR